MQNEQCLFHGGNRSIVMSAVCTLAFFISTFYFSPAFSQTTFTVTGTVTGANNTPLQGVSVVEKASARGTITNQNGYFSLPVSSSNGTLVIDYVGYTTQEIPIAGRTNVTISLAQGENIMNDVVVIGYQTVRKRDLTGATSIVDVEQLNKNTTSTVAEALQGLAAGVSVKTNGEPGGGAKIDIRGTGTFGRNNPLYVIDGMLSDATPDFNPNDIETIQILKDASAAAIYGSRAANGVIIITTKKGKQGPLVIGGNVKYGYQQFHKRWDLMNSTQYAALNKQAYINSGFTPPASSDAEFNPAINTDWQDLMMKDGSTQDYMLSLSGGSNTATYYLSGDYFKNSGTLIDNSFERAGVRLNTTGQRGRFKVGENVYLSYTHTDPAEGNVFLDMLSMPPTMPVRDTSRYYDAVENPQAWSYGDPQYANTFGTNTYALNQLRQTDLTFYKVRGNAFVEFRIFDFLNYKYNAGIEASFDYVKQDQLPGRIRQGTPYMRPTLNESRNNFLSFLNEHTLNFDKQFGDHKISAVAGISSQTFKVNTLDIQKIDLAAYSGEYYFVPGQSGTPVVGGGIYKWANLGYLGRVNYSYADKYLLSGTIRRDADTRFGPANRWGTFPAISGAWRVSKESFFNVNAINDLKFRASYGELGNSEILSPFQYAGNISAFPRYVFGTNQTITPGATNIALANPDLRWETKKTTNIGMDMTLFNNRFTTSVDYFIIKTSDVLVNLPIPLTTGNAGGNPPVNAASLENKGFEFTGTYHSAKNPFSWNLSANVTVIKNKVTSLGDIGDKLYIQLGDTRTLSGQPIGVWYVMKTDGIFQTQEQIDAYRNKDGELIEPWAKPGDIKYVDVDGDGEINFDKDRTFSGTPWPDLEAGLVWDASYKGFSFSMQWYGVFGNTVYNRPLYNLDKLGPSDDQAYRAGIQPWTPENHSTELPRIGHSTSQQPDQGLVYNANPQSDRWLEDGSYVRLRNLELGYDFSLTMLDRIGFKTGRIYVSGQNLITITKYKGLDPDITGPNIFERGLDYGQYPPLRIYSVGLQFGF